MKCEVCGKVTKGTNTIRRRANGQVLCKRCWKNFINLRD